ncbi:hypothetical protein B484DRAFT_454502 [Ochromonadaceae sp. CCMP2298]|nr:hypothetical protein B484DRAFT_455808 [Ochromonadaceae sp. CCMP2298]KAJ1415658.1 hypothetical protein B484DRAFT_454502 [Ochromonadaceae sp. CCMP2298]
MSVSEENVTTTTAYSLLAHSLLTANYSSLTTAYCLLPTAYCLLNLRYHQRTAPLSALRAGIWYYTHIHT